MIIKEDKQVIWQVTGSTLAGNTANYRELMTKILAKATFSTKNIKFMYFGVDQLKVELRSMLIDAGFPNSTRFNHIDSKGSYCYKGTLSGVPGSFEIDIAVKVSTPN